MPGIDMIAGLAIVVAFVVVSVATADAGALEQRMRRRGSVGESAEAIRHAQDVMDYARGGYLGVVCTPSRRLRLSGDLESEASPPNGDPPRQAEATAVEATAAEATAVEATAVEATAAEPTASEPTVPEPTAAATASEAIAVMTRPASEVRHLVPRHAVRRRAPGRGIRVLVGRRRSRAGRTLTRAERRARATTRPPAGTR